MGSIPEDTVVCKCLDLLDIGDYRSIFLDHRSRKFTTGKAIKWLIEGQLKQRNDLDEIAEHLQSSEKLQKLLDLESISSSQISRKLRALSSPMVQALFLQIVGQLHNQTKDRKGIKGIGRLSILDSTSLTLPKVAGEWAYCHTSKNAVKMHTRFIVTDHHISFPDRIIASTADVTDSEVAMELVVADDAIYVMDRGYIVYKNYKAWAESGIRFVARIQQRNITQIIREREVPKSSTIQRDADVIVTFEERGEEVQVELRLVEFHDEKGRPYRILTDVHDLSAEQISEAYRHRWMIELFFKWIKQHLNLVKLHSVKPDAVWSQMYLALIAYCLVLLIKLETGTNRTPWQVLKLLRLYANDSWQDFLSALFRKPTRTSQDEGRKLKWVGRVNIRQS